MLYTSARSTAVTTDNQMDIVKLGVVVDPIKTTEGAAKVKDQLRQIGPTAKTELGKLDEANRKTGASMQALGQKAKQTGVDIQASGRHARAGFADMARGAMDVLDAGGLLNNGFGGMLRRVDSAIRGGQQLAAVHRGLAGSTGEAAAGMGRMASATGSATTGAGGLLARLGLMAPMLAGIAAALIIVTVSALAVVAIFKAISASIPESAKMEQFGVRMAVAMGSFTKAQEKFKELKKFADETPFSDEEVFSAGTALQSGTKGALTTPEALKAIGGAASQAGKSFSEMAENVMAVYNGLKYGGDTIDYLKTMASKGIIDGATLQAVRQLGEEADKSGNKTKNAAKQWALVYGDLEKKSIALILQSRTWNGLVSTLSGNWDSVKQSFGEPIMNALKPILLDLIAILPRIKEIAATSGTAIGNTIRILYEAFTDGRVGELLGTSIMGGVETAVSWFSTQWIAGTIYWGNALGNALGNAAAAGAEALRAAYEGVISWIGTKLQSYALDAAKVAAKPVGGVISILPGFVKTGIRGAVDMSESYAKESADAAKQRKLINDALPAGSPLKDPTGPDGMVLPPKGGAFAFTPVENDWSKIVADVKKDNLTGDSWRKDTAAMRAELIAQNTAKAPPFKDSDLGKIGPPGIDNPNVPKPGGAGGAKDPPPKAIVVESKMDSLLKEWGDVGKQLDQTFANIAQSISGNMSGALTDMITGAKDAKTAFTDMANGIIADIVKMIIQMTIQLAIHKALGGSGATFQAIAAGAIAHTGGTVGQTNLSQVPKFHQGGNLSSEGTVRVDKGETILTRRRSAELQKELNQSRQTRQSGNQGGNAGTATIINVLDRNEIADAVARSPGAVVNAMSRNLPSVRKMVMTGNRA